MSMPSAHPLAKQRQRRRLERAHPPITEPLAQDYAAWRGSMLRRVLVGTVLQFVFTSLGGTGPDPTGVASGEELQEAGSGPGSSLIGLLLPLYFTGTGLLSFLLIAWAAIRWPQVRTSQRLARAAWFFYFFSPLLIFLIPPNLLVAAGDQDSLLFSLQQTWAIITFYGPGLFAFLPAVIRAALLLKRFLPESQLPGVLALLAAPFAASVYLLTLVICLQLTVNPALIVGLALITLGALLHLPYGPALLRRNPGPETRKTVGRLELLQAVLTIGGLALLALYVTEFPMLRRLLGNVSLAWFLGFIAGINANRTLLTVVLTDFLLSLLHQSQQAARQLAGTELGQALERKIDTLGSVLQPTADKV